VIPKNPARKVELPKCKPAKETRSLTEHEVRRIFDKTYARNYVFWRLFLLTGARLSEVLALNRSDLVPGGSRSRRAENANVFGHSAISYD
jgi:integrase